MNNKNTLVLGNGFISSHLNYAICPDRIIPDENYIRKLYDKYNPDVIINCIGYCGNPTIDACLEDKSRTVKTNTLIPIMLADIARDFGIRMIHIGSGCIFSQQSPNIVYTKRCYSCGDEYCTENEYYDSGFKETDAANPVSFYSETKCATDLAIKSFDNVSIVRIRMPISDKINQRNLLSKITKYSKIVEEPNSMTFMVDLINAIDWIIDNNKYGIYNVVSPTPIKHSELLTEYQKYLPDHKYQKISPNELDAITTSRRSNCILNVDKIKSEGFVFQDTNKNIVEYVEKYCKNLKSK